MNSWKTRLELIAVLVIINQLYSFTVGGLGIYPAQYWFAGIAGTITVLGMHRLGKDAIIVDAEKFQAIFVGVHGYGLLIYQLGFPPDSYDNVQPFLSYIQYLWILWARHDLRGNRLYNNGGDRIFHFNFNLRQSNIAG